MLFPDANARLGRLQNAALVSTRTLRAQDMVITAIVVKWAAVS
jgi:hypothetical protein